MKSILEVLELISDSDTKSKILALYNSIDAEMDKFPASVKHHHYWPGGYRTHIEEVLNNALSIFNICTLSGKLPAEVFLDDVIVCAFVHDLDKILRYDAPVDEQPSDKQINYAKSLGISVLKKDNKASISRKIAYVKEGTPIEPVFFSYNKSLLEVDDSARVCQMCAKFCLILTDMQLHAITYHHGGWSARCMSGERCELRPLAIILHCADLISAHVYGKALPPEYDITDEVAKA